MSKKMSCQVTVEREPGFWIIRVPEIAEVVTQARRLADVKENARDCLLYTSGDRTHDRGIMSPLL